MPNRRRERPRRGFPPVPTREIEQFITVVRRLRRDCPWDRRQTHGSLRASLIEEAYEVSESITRRRLDELKGELGDLLLHIVLQATIAEQEGVFTLREVLDGVTDKMIRRHPHVFGKVRARTSAQVKDNWETIKLAEGRSSLLEGVPTALPALLRARRIQERAAKVGFDWKRREEVWQKVQEEMEEFRQTLAGAGAIRREEEFGDILFSLVNYARFMRIDPEHALHRTTGKFARRFRQIERAMRAQGKDIRHASLEEMDAIWNRIKKRKKNSDV
ncbi:MAG TPA: nucleoside triphosphate pyrophosphohydrolase [Bacteroidota bacterium]